LELTEGRGLVQAVHIVHGSGVLNLDENDELTLVFTGTRKSHIDSVELSTDDGTGCTTAVTAYKDWTTGARFARHQGRGATPASAGSATPQRLPGPGHGVEDCPATSVHGLHLHCDQPCNAHVNAGAGSKRVLAGRL
jgi:hypothetical protein